MDGEEVNVTRRFAEQLEPILCETYEDMKPAARVVFRKLPDPETDGIRVLLHRWGRARPRLQVSRIRAWIDRIRLKQSTGPEIN